MSPAWMSTSTPPAATFCASRDAVYCELEMPMSAYASITKGYAEAGAPTAFGAVKMAGAVAPHGAPPSML